MTVDHPDYYRKGTGHEAIDVIEAWGLGFCLGNAVKYIARAGKKGDRVEDLRKARWYLDREIEKAEPKPGHKHGIAVIPKGDKVGIRDGPEGSCWLLSKEEAGKLADTIQYVAEDKAMTSATSLWEGGPSAWRERGNGGLIFAQWDAIGICNLTDEEAIRLVRDIRRVKEAMP